MEVGPITVKMILGRERSFGQKQGEEKETSPFQRQQYYSAGSAVPRSAGFIAVQRDPHKDKSNSLPPPPPNYGRITAQHCGQGCQSEEDFGFLVPWHFAGHSFNLSSDLSQNPPLLRSLMSTALK